MRKLGMLTVISMMMFMVILSGCGTATEQTDNSKAKDEVQETAPKAEKETAKDDGDKATDEANASTELKESPVLAGKGLPPVAERLPKEPKLTNEMPLDQLDYEIGTYGGNLRTVRNGTWDATIFILQNEPLLNSPGLLGNEVTGNVLKGFEVTQDQKTYTFYMREGLKWSDGVPVTSEDVRFAVEDVLFNTELTPGGPPSWLKASADATAAPMELEVIDDYTFKISFEKPYGNFPIQLAVMGWKGYSDLLKPKHFLEQFHTTYTPLENLEAKIKERGHDAGQWVNLFHEIDVTNWESPNPQAVGFPTLYPYIQLESTSDTILYERNPYYFKVDAAGNQLPYIDTVSSTLVQDIETAIMKVMAGEVDHSYEYVSLPKVPLMKENEAKGGYKVYMTDLHRSAADFILNMTFDDPVWREVVRDLRFRKAINLAINKQEIADSVYYGFARPSTVEDTTFDVEAANQILDDMGMKKGSDGFRLGPDGKKFTIPIEHGGHFSDINELGELIVEQLSEIGIHATLKMIDPSLWGERVSANQLQGTFIWATPGPVMWPNQDWIQGYWAPLWNRWWNTQGKEGEEPPEDVKHFYKLISSFQELSLADSMEQRDLVVQSIRDNLWFFIPLEGISAPVAVNAKIGNFSDKGFGIAHNFAGEQWFFKP